MEMKVLPPSVNVVATGLRILELRKARNLTVRDLQEYMGFDAPQAIYKWQKGQCLPTVDNLLALSDLLGVPLEDILVRNGPQPPNGPGGPGGSGGPGGASMTCKEPKGSVFLCGFLDHGAWGLTDGCKKPPAFSNGWGLWIIRSNSARKRNHTQAS